MSVTFSLTSELFLQLFAFLTPIPRQRNLRMSLTISLDAMGACLAGISMTIPSRVFAFCCTIVLLASPDLFLAVAPIHIIAQA